MKSPNGRYRPSDLAREWGLSAQAVRNYERDGALPPAARSETGYRQYTEVHRAALAAYLAMIGGHGHDAAREIMRAVHRGDLDAALREISRGHAGLQHDRETLDAVRKAISLLPHAGAPTGPLPIGALAHRLGVRPATLRKWERAGILTPQRERATGYRLYSATDVRDADLAQLLRRGGYPLAYIAGVISALASAPASLASAPALLEEALVTWEERLTARGRAMLAAAARLDAFLSLS